MVEFVLGKRGPAMNRSIAAALLAVVALSLAGCDEAPTKTEVAQSPKPAQSEAAKSFATAYAAIQREDYATALPILKELEAQGNASAQFYLGKMYLYGYGVERDYATALPILKELEAQGNATAQYNLGEMYRQGQGVAQDYKEAVRLYGLAAAQGDARAQWELGEMYIYGHGVERDGQEYVRLQDLSRAQRHWSGAKAHCDLEGKYDLDLNSSVARCDLGVMYDKGTGVAQDYKEAVRLQSEGFFKEAVRLYGLAAAQGYARAQTNLGWMYNNGQGVAQDYKEAVRLYGLAAAQGDARAQYNLGVMYANGRGVAKDNVRAHMWYNITAILDTSVEQIASERRRDRELDDMTPAQIAEAQEMARKCQASNFKQCD